MFQARHTTYGIRKSFLFLLQCQLSLVIIQVRADALSTDICAALLALYVEIQAVLLNKYVRCAAVSLQFLACLAQLPPPMNTTDILWLSCFSCPLLRYTRWRPVRLLRCAVPHRMSCLRFPVVLAVCRFWGSRPTACP